MKRRGTYSTFSYSRFYYGECFTTRYGSAFPVTEQPKAVTGSSTSILKSSKLTEREIGGTQFPIWRLDGVILMALLHAGPVEFVYYWLHRALHHHYLYSRSHHHSSIVPEPIT
ncbi:hypothetical protein CISIN_1g0165312mg, partial [Citrus sinensis]